MARLYGGIEAGGTKFVCTVANVATEEQPSYRPMIQEEIRFPTTQPEKTIQQAVNFFRKHQESLVALGIGSFGPVDLNPDSPTYGYITTTPKKAWVETDFVGQIEEAFGLPVGFDTDVNAAALGERHWGAARGLDSFIYLTIGTGFGGGGMINGRLLHGLVHPEMGHMRLPHDWEDDPFPGLCPYHGDCLEGMAAGPAIEARWGKRAEQLAPDHPAWELEARYLAFALVNLICVLSPQRIILGGGVMSQPQLFTLVHRQVPELLNEYVQAPAIIEGIESYIVPPSLGNQAGALGAIALAQAAASSLNG